MSNEIKKAVEKVENNIESPLIIKNEKGQVLGEYSPQLVETIKSTVAKGASDDELYMFLQVASMYDLNPFLKEIWFTKFKNKQTGRSEVTIMTSRDGYAKLAKKDIRFRKCQSVAVYENDDFQMNLEMGEVKSINHTYKHTDRGKLVGAYAVLSTIDNDNLVSYVDFKEYDQRNTIWRKYPSSMIRKVAENDVYKRFSGANGLATVEDMPHPYILDANEKNVTDFSIVETEVVE